MRSHATTPWWTQSGSRLLCPGKSPGAAPQNFTIDDPRKEALQVEHLRYVPLDADHTKPKYTITGTQETSLVLRNSQQFQKSTYSWNLHTQLGHLFL